MLKGQPSIPIMPFRYQNPGCILPQSERRDLKTMGPRQPQVLTSRAALLAASVALAFTVNPSQGAVIGQNASTPSSQKESSGCGPECLGRCFDGHCLFDDQGLAGDQEFEDGSELSAPAPAEKRSVLSKSLLASRAAKPPPAATAESNSLAASSVTEADGAKATQASKRLKLSRSALAAAQAESGEFGPETEEDLTDSRLLGRLDRQAYEALAQEILSRERAPRMAATPRAHKRALLRNGQQHLGVLETDTPLEDDDDLSNRNMFLGTRARSAEASSQRLQEAEAAVDRLRLENSVLRDQLDGWRRAGAHVAEREAQVVQLLGHGGRPAQMRAAVAGGPRHSADPAFKPETSAQESLTARAASAMLPAAPSAPPAVAAPAQASGPADAGAGSAEHVAPVLGPREMIQLLAGKSEDHAFLPVPELFFFIEFVMVGMVLCGGYLFRGSLSSFLFGTDDMVKLLNFPRSKYTSSNLKHYSEHAEEEFPIEGNEVEEAVDETPASYRSRVQKSQKVLWEAQEATPHTAHHSRLGSGNQFNPGQRYSHTERISSA
mmetsp:Transcript_25878/g.44672  ORF Transcript_25878/g.44672 Transcript_25878/m.44672 type:complete len:550 (+) Transcript_25878:3-1652(+)